jgi:surface carbohydrate biosynthesis protein (TIGR04326 family)
VASLKNHILVHTSHVGTFTQEHGSKLANQSWVYLGSDYFAIQNLVQQGFSEHKRIRYSKELQESGYELQNEYTQFIADLSRKHNSVAWWNTRLAEKNNQVTLLYLHLCYLHVLQKTHIFSSVNSAVVIICDSTFLCDAILENFPSVTLYKSHKREAFINRVKGWLKVCAGLPYFLGISLYHSWLASQSKKSQKAEKSTNSKKAYVFTYVSSDRFGKEHFNDRYFPGLSSYLQEQNFDVRYIPVTETIQQPQKNIISWLRDSSTEFVVAEDYYTITDYLWAVVQHLKKITLYRTIKSTIHSLNVQALLSEIFFFDIGNIRILRFLLLYRLIYRITQKEQIDVFIQPFENILTEKSQLQALKEFSPQTVTVGFQHGGIFPLGTAYWSDAKEHDILPQPQHILANGAKFKEILEQLHYKQNVVSIGAALRYAYLYDQDTPQFVRVSTHSQKYIFVPLPMQLEAAAELLEKVCSCQFEQAILVVKRHPMTTKEQILKGVSEDGQKVLAASIWAEGTMNEVLEQYPPICAISLSSSVSLELFVSNIAVVRVSRETELDLDAIGWVEGLPPSATSVEELQVIIDSIMNSSDTFPSQNENVKQSWFKPVTQQSLHAFLGNVTKG